MEKGVALEAGISELLGMLLDIEVANSLSLGTKNSSLSLNSKVNLLCDLKFVPKNLIWQFQMFTEIRNKFAHLQYVDSFEKCFEVIKDKKNKFLKEFGQNISESETEEIKLSVCFSVLCISLGIWLQLILKKTHFNKSQDLKKTAVVESLREFFKVPENEQRILEEQLKFVDNLIQDIEIDQDFAESIEEARNMNKKEKQLQLTMVINNC